MSTNARNRTCRQYPAGPYPWFEEPMQPYLRDSHARLAASLDIPIAIGENYFTRHQFYDVIKMGAVDIVQPDNRRAGGVTEWMDIGAISEAAGLNWRVAGVVQRM